MSPEILAWTIELALLAGYLLLGLYARRRRPGNR
jgi:hypothetical protein